MRNVVSGLDSLSSWELLRIRFISHEGQAVRDHQSLSLSFCGQTEVLRVKYQEHEIKNHQQ